MLQAHSPLWHYLWIAPNVLLLLLAFEIWRRRLVPRFPAFFAFAILSSVGELAVYAADVFPWVSPKVFWRVDWASLMVEAILKFVLLGEIFAYVLGSYASLARVSRLLIRGTGIALVMAAAVAAAYAPKDGLFGIVSGAHLLEQTVYIIECGLLVSIFLISSYFNLSWKRPVLGIALGLGISSCIHLAFWAFVANANPSNSVRAQLDFVPMATYHFCVLVWCYYFLVPRKVEAATPVALPENILDVWNRELERLLQQ